MGYRKVLAYEELPVVHGDVGATADVEGAVSDVFGTSWQSVCADDGELGAESSGNEGSQSDWDRLGLVAEGASLCDDGVPHQCSLRAPGICEPKRACGTIRGVVRGSEGWHSVCVQRHVAAVSEGDRGTDEPGGASAGSVSHHGAFQKGGG